MGCRCKTREIGVQPINPTGIVPSDLATVKREGLYCIVTKADRKPICRCRFWPHGTRVMACRDHYCEAPLIREEQRRIWQQFFMTLHRLPASPKPAPRVTREVPKPSLFQPALFGGLL